MDFISLKGSRLSTTRKQYLDDTVVKIQLCPKKGLSVPGESH